MTTPTTEAPAEKISSEDLARLVRANAQLGAATDRLQQLQDTAAKVRDEVVGAQAVLVHMSKEIADKYGIKDGDIMDQEGTITRKAG